MKRRIFSSVIVLLVLFGVWERASAKAIKPVPRGKRIYDMKWLNINRWKCPFYNDGRYGIDVTVGTGVAGGSWPQPLHNCYIFGAGMWFGSLKPRADGKVDTLVSFGYNPNSGGTELTPTTVKNAAEGAGSPDDRIFVYPSDWPPSPRSRWETGDPRMDSILIPYEAFSLQDMWCVYSDAAPENHIAPGKPQNIDVYQVVYAWNYPSNQDIFFILYYVRNSGDDTLKRCFIGAVMDPDIGDATDDMVGFILRDSIPGAGWVENVGYAGDNDNVESPGTTWESGTPGVFAYKFLDSPKRDSITPSGDTIEIPLGMTAFKKFTIDIDPVTDPAQYLTMAGYDYRTGVYSAFDSVDVTPADKRFIQCSGPFDLAPGQVERLVVAAIGAPFGGPNQPWANRPKDSLVHLAQVAIAAQFIFDQGWLLPGPPVSPNITLIPGDKVVRIVWDDLPERTPDRYWEKVASQPGPGYDPMYRGYDFQGYVVYKSRDGSNWQILGQCDLIDSITFSYPPGGDSTQADSLWINATDNGVYYTLVDKDVINGFKYYYCVTAYDWNYITTEKDSLGNPIKWDTLILRSGIVSNFSTVPRWEPVNYVAPEAQVVRVVGDSISPALVCSTTVVVPFKVTSDVYELRFLGPSWTGSSAKALYSYYVVNTSRGDSLIGDTSSFTYTIATSPTTASIQVPVFNGQALQMKMRMKIPTAPFDGVNIVSGSYPAESLKIGGAPSQAYWAFRGSDYRIEWVNNGGYLTAKVYDVTNGDIEVPFAKFTTTGTGPQNANGWCFVDRAFRNPTDTLKGTVANIYICGGYLGLKQSGDSLRGLLSSINDGDVWSVVGHRAEGAAPFFNVFRISATPGYTDTTTEQKLAVKVVPNPYIVFNGWEKTSEQRVIKFTHLPGTCTIRIFTTAGDLLKVIEHKDTKKQPLDEGGTATWDLINDYGQLIAPGVYIYHVESPVGEFTGKFMVIH
ncbi:hypothetical protein HPY86_03570 [candidate division WOR-3 bacterium]|nr:hypothetical protein [candidate division WOR-3 bacterium]